MNVVLIGHYFEYLIAVMCDLFYLYLRLLWVAGVWGWYVWRFRRINLLGLGLGRLVLVFPDFMIFGLDFGVWM